MKQRIFFTGGCRSGKSAAAQRWAELQAPNRVFLATAEVFDAEMARRVELHQTARGKGWQTVELPMREAMNLNVFLERAGQVGQEARGAGVLLLDCLSLWVSAAMEANPDDDAVLAALEKALQSLHALPLPVAVVSIETGLGLVPSSPEARRYRDLLGLANQRMAAFCDTAVFMVSGLPLVLKGNYEHRP